MIESKTIVDFDEDIREEANKKIKEMAVKEKHTWKYWPMVQLEVENFCKHGARGDGHPLIDFVFERLEDAKLFVEQCISKEKWECGCDKSFEIYPMSVMKAFKK